MQSQDNIVSQSALENFETEGQRDLQGSGEYAAAGLKRSLHGDIYQLKLLMLFLKRGVEKNYEFKLATEMEQAAKFDDVVFKYSPEVTGQKGTQYRYRYLQAKHKHDSKISDTDLFADDSGDFSLKKYFSSYTIIKEGISDGELEELTICTNIGFNFDGDNDPKRIIKLKDALEEVSGQDKILNVNVRGKEVAARYRFKKDFFGKKELYAALKSSVTYRIAGEIVECIVNKKTLDLRSPVFNIYHRALMKEILHNKTEKELRFQVQFINGDENLSPLAQSFRQIFFNKIIQHEKLKNKFSSVPKGSEEPVKVFLRNSTLPGSETFGKKETQNSVDNLPEEAQEADIDAFLKYLVFAVDQPTEVELGDIIKEELESDFNLINSSLVASHFQEEMLDWMKKKKGTFLSIQDGKAFFKHANQMVAQLILIGPTLEHHETLKQRGISFKQSFDLSGFLSAKARVLNYISPNETWLSSIKVVQALKDSEDFKKQGSHIFIKIGSFIRLADHVIPAFKSDTKLLIIECDVSIDGVTFSELANQLLGILEKFNDRKIILISKQGTSLLHLFDEKITCDSKPDDDNDFEHLADVSKKALKSKRIIFQGNKTSLSELVSDENLNEMIKSKELLELVSPEDIMIDFAPVTLGKFEESCYIDRVLEAKKKIKQECLHENKSDLFALSGMGKEDLRQIIPAGEKIRTFDEKEDVPSHPVRYILLGNKTAEKEFNDLTLQFPKETIHWLKKENEYFSWEMSKGSVSGLRKFLADEKEELNTDIASPKIIIISTNPGMGKTTSIDYLASQEKKRNSSRWVIKIDLKAQQEMMKNFDTLEDVISFLSKILKLYPLGSALLNYFVLQSKITFYLDGFDEIGAAHQIKMIQFMKVLKHHGENIQMVVSTRRHMQDSLEDEFSVFSYELRPFLNNDKILFLRKFWSKNLEITREEKNEKFNQFSKQLLSLFEGPEHGKMREFISVPLHARLLAEAFQDEFKSYFCDGGTINLPPTLDMAELYDRFIKQKYAIWLKEKKKIDPSGMDYMALFLDATKKHQALAFQLLFKDKIDNVFVDNEPSLFSEDELKHVGIIHVYDGQIHFIHRTFAEYFVAEFFLKCLKSQRSSNYQIVNDFLKKEIFKSRHEVIRNFLERLVEQSKDALLEKTWREICKSRIIDSSKSTEGGFSISDKIEDDQLSTSEDGSIAKFYADMNKLKDFHKRIQEWNLWAKTRDFLEEFFKSICNIKDITRLEEVLVILADMGIQTKMNNIKDKILSNINHLIDHYLSQIFFIEMEGDIGVKYELLEKFTKISPNMRAYERGREIGGIAAQALETLKARVSEYKKLNDLKPEDLNKQVFWGHFSFEKLLFLRFRKHQFSQKQLEALMSYHDNPLLNENYYYKKIYNKLFLQIDVSHFVMVKEFLIEKKEYELLAELRNQFNIRLTKEKIIELNQSRCLALTENNIEKIYFFGRPSHSSSFYRGYENILWLEDGFAKISFSFRKLNKTMANYFISELPDRSIINNFHTKYLKNVFENLILPLLDVLKDGDATDVHILYFIDMLSKFSGCAFKYDINISITMRQFETVFKLLEQIFNDPLISKDTLEIGVPFLIDFVKIFRLILIETPKKLLVLEPVSDFSYEFNLTRQKEIVSLLRLKEGPSQDNFSNDCNKIIEAIKTQAIEDQAISGVKKLISQKKMFIPKFIQIVSGEDQPIQKDKTSRPQGGRKRALSDPGSSSPPKIPRF